ncbi:collagen alpha-4(IV) chain-like [Cyprinodon tularosa]|uniref:collagen alpha-4(IV) chain-like n=1 Tax=Cyprinodon tularosa TaxID=77115 RepID=UPI0018E25256|nr:collagen alpha-4(IV) chain-like [Cyprinodon tularosa]
MLSPPWPNGSSEQPGQQGTGGYPDEKGIRGDMSTVGHRENGLKGNPGNPGALRQTGLREIVGPAGDPGIDGLHRQKGLAGPIGLPRLCKILKRRKGKEELSGPPGYSQIEGFQGQMRHSGNPGDQVDLGQPGPLSISCLPRSPGAKGTSLIYKGDPGPMGHPGSPGSKSFQGPHGSSGLPEPKDKRDHSGGRRPDGPKSQKGISGPQGCKGDHGPTRGAGSPLTPVGVSGFNGPQGAPGPPGHLAEPGNKGPRSSFLLVIHSQSVEVPQCPAGSNQLWVGYSLVHLEGQYRAQTEDLGKPGSCLPVFSTMPFSFCNREACYHSSSNGKSYWLSTSASIPMRPLFGQEVSLHISRCVVCEALSPAVPFHSQHQVIPLCPLGWRSLWTGYSFLLHTGVGDGGGQSLASSGSCLKDFRTHPFIECQGAQGSCHYFSNLYSFWLITIRGTKEFNPSHGRIKPSEQQRFKARRCNVCLRD